MEAIVEFPEDILEFQSIASDTALPTELAQDSTAGLVSIAVGSGPETPFQGMGSIAKIRFKALKAGTATLTFGADTGVAAVGYSSNVLGSKSPLTLEIVNQSAVINFDSDTDLVRTGESVPAGLESARLSWSIQNADEVSIAPGIGIVGNEGEQDVSPETTTEYTINVSGPGGDQSKRLIIMTRNIANMLPPFDTPVGPFDYGAVVSAYGTTGENIADIDGDGKVGIFDYGILVSNYGK